MEYAAKVQREIDRLPARKSFEKRREHIVHRSGTEAEQEYQYQGTEADWDFLVLHVGQRQPSPRTVTAAAGVDSRTERMADKLLTIGLCVIAGISRLISLD